jgi:ADP-ribose pyrophosphatase YjhB (NUDIX family)
VSINPALEDVRFCPRCGAEPRVAFPRSISCPACGYVAFYNPKPVAAAIPVQPDGAIWLLRRAFDPGGGLWTFPGGFVDLGESVADAARRETREEMEIEVELGPLVGVYSRAEDRVVLVVFAATPARRAAGHGGGDRGPCLRARPPAMGRARLLVDRAGAAGRAQATPRPSGVNELHTVDAGAPRSGPAWTSRATTHLTH